MAWLYLLLAGMFEIGWPVGFKLSQQPTFRVWGIAGAIVSMGCFGLAAVARAARHPIGTAYAVWTGIGGAGTFVIGVLFFGDALTLLRTLGVMMIVGGVVVLELSH